ncbi:hypothetical protein GCM10010145_65010 [Streptomyces ruber]|uniref:Uncharacterized protein n=2 Tax=Streptomyces TaxID=1883 RepID=A0A918EZX6_9ACTN|nr:hypothetical protein GCM10010145_65010 [Streptomyces ruber]
MCRFASGVDGSHRTVHGTCPVTAISRYRPAREGRGCAMTDPYGWSGASGGSDTRSDDSGTRRPERGPDAQDASEGRALPEEGGFPPVPRRTPPGEEPFSQEIPREQEEPPWVRFA